jgi:hypothetical protein
VLDPGIHKVRFVFAGGSTYMDIDQIQIVGPVGAGVYDDTHAAWQYSGSWSLYNAGGPANNTMHYTGAVGSYAELTFSGTRFIVMMQRNTNRGLIEVYIDDSPTPLDTINANGPLQWQWTWTSPVLDPGIHKVRFVFAGGSTYMDIDQIQIQ